jgi:cellulose synthase/poly-beta-1,6-N-acetylglucosamine synthase-like glycosyltransferase
VADKDGVVSQVTAYCGLVQDWLFRGNFINTSSVLVRREALLEAGGFDETLVTEEDYDCWLKIARRWKFLYLDVPLVAFRRRPGQLTAPERIEVVIRNVRTVVERAAGEMEGSIDPDVRRSRLSGVRRQLAVACLRNGKTAEARTLLRQSLKTWPPNVLSLILLVFAHLPDSVFQAFERGRRRLKKRLPGSV